MKNMDLLRGSEVNRSTSAATVPAVTLPSNSSFNSSEPESDRRNHGTASCVAHASYKACASSSPVICLTLSNLGVCERAMRLGEYASIDPATTGLLARKSTSSTLLDSNKVESRLRELLSSIRTGLLLRRLRFSTIEVLLGSERALTGECPVEGKGVDMERIGRLCIGSFDLMGGFGIGVTGEGGYGTGFVWTSMV